MSFKSYFKKIGNNPLFTMFTGFMMGLFFIVFMFAMLLSVLLNSSVGIVDSIEINININSTQFAEVLGGKMIEYQESELADDYAYCQNSLKENIRTENIMREFCQPLTYDQWLKLKQEVS